MKTITQLGTFGMVVIPIAIAITIAGIIFVSQVIAHNLNLY